MTRKVFTIDSVTGEMVKRARACVWGLGNSVWKENEEEEEECESKH